MAFSAAVEGLNLLVRRRTKLRQARSLSAPPPKPQ
jgi:hypothetical protein